jgi:MFS family permease
LSKSSRAPLLIIFITVFIDLLGFGIVLPLLPRYAVHFQAGGNLLGLLMASFSAMQFLFAPLWGRVSDRVGRRPILILGLAGSTFFYSLFGYATSLGVNGELLGLGVLPWLFICRIGAGIAGATIPTAQAYIADVTGPQERAKGMALIGAAFGIGFTFGPLLGWAFLPAASAAADSVPSSAPGYVASVLSGLAMLSAIFLLPESLKPGATGESRQWFDVSSFKLAIASPAMALILFTIFLTTFAFGQFESTLSLLTRYLGLADNDNYVVFAYVGFILTLSQGLIVRRLVPRVGEVVMCRAGTALMTLGLVLIGLSGREKSTTMLYCVLPVVVIGFSAVTPSLQSLLSRHTSAADQGSVLGVGQSMSALARILGPWLGMTLIGDDADLVGARIVLPYWTGAGLMVLSILLTLALSRPSDAPVS